MFAIGKRVFLFLLTNFLILMTISLVINFLGIGPYLTDQGLDPIALMGFCLIWGMGGAFVSLMLSKVMAKWMMGVKIIDPRRADPELLKLVEAVHELARSAKLPKMPEVGIYESPEINAFATGPTKSNSLVAVSTGLLNRMSNDEVLGVLSHEIAHIANGDMVTMTLIQGVVNAFVMFLARALAFVIAQTGRGRDSEEGGGLSSMSYFLLVMMFDLLFGILGHLVVAWFSRHREFRADQGGAKIGGKDRMVAALERLKSSMLIHDPATDKPAFQSLKISTRSSGWMALFSTHPPLDLRIARLETMTSV